VRSALPRSPVPGHRQLRGETLARGHPTSSWGPASSPARRRRRGRASPRGRLIRTTKARELGSRALDAEPSCGESAHMLRCTDCIDRVLVRLERDELGPVRAPRGHLRPAVANGVAAVVCRVRTLARRSALGVAGQALP